MTPSPTSNPNRPACFVLMPFGVKLHPDSGASIDFDAFYESSVRPALNSAGMDAVRVDQDFASLAEDMVQERLLSAEFAIADVTTRDPAILFMLGARAGRMPGVTIVLAARGSETQLASRSAISVVAYDLDEGNRLTSRESLRFRKTLAAALSQMIGSVAQTAGRQERQATSIEHERSTHGVALAQAIETAGDKRDVAELQRLETELAQHAPDSPLLLNIFQAYGNLGVWPLLVSLYRRLPREMQKLPRIRQQTALALNRMQQRDEALSMLSTLLKEQVTDSETFGLLGRIYKDQWFETKDPAALDRAVEFYMKGFEANRKDSYPGLNAVTLLEIRGDADSLHTKDRLLPLVSAAVEDQFKQSRRRIYWDYATLLELAVLAGDQSLAQAYLSAALGLAPDDWQTETTANKLVLIREARANRGDPQPWLDQILSELHNSSVAA